MTHYETIQQGIEAAAELICRHLDCDHCPASERCGYGDNGMKHWLELEDYEDDD